MHFFHTLRKEKNTLLWTAAITSLPNGSDGTEQSSLSVKTQLCVVELADELGLSSCGGIFVENSLGACLVNSLDGEADSLLRVGVALRNRGLSLFDVGLEVGLNRLVAGGFAGGDKHSLLCGLNIRHRYTSLFWFSRMNQFYHESN